MRNTDKTASCRIYNPCCDSAELQQPLKHCVSLASRTACQPYVLGKGAGAHRSGGEAGRGASEEGAGDGGGARLGCEDGNGRLGRQRSRLGVLRHARCTAQLRRGQCLPRGSCLAGDNLHNRLIVNIFP